MIDLILNAVKIAVSEDTRKSASALVDFIKRSPAWQQEICTLEAHIENTSVEHAYLLGGLTSDKMQSLGYTSDAITAFEYTYRELTSNAFEHGCRPGSKDRVTIAIDITMHYVSFAVRNPSGRQFELEQIIESQRTNLTADQRSKRGRGLVIAAEFADSLSPIENGEGVKAVFYKPAVVLRLSQLDDVAIIHVIDGLENPSIRRRIRDIAEPQLGKHLILDLVKFAAKPELRTPSTTLLTGSLELQEKFQAAGRRMVLLVNPKPSSKVFRLGIFDPSILAYSVNEALNKIGKPQLRDELKRLIARQHNTD